VAGQSKVLIPGDPEREYHAERLASGIPLLPPVWEDLRTTGEKFNIKF
jgi:LDH2 family malate/lactate/ureidoglycolate dehydrogenase